MLLKGTCYKTKTCQMLSAGFTFETQYRVQLRCAHNKEKNKLWRYFYFIICISSQNTVRSKNIQHEIFTNIVK